MSQADRSTTGGEREELSMAGMAEPYSRDAKHDPSRLLRLMVTVAVISMIATMILGTMVFHRVYSDHVIDIAEREAMQISKAMIRTERGLLLKPAAQMGEMLSIDRHLELDTRLRAFLDTFAILKINIYTPEWLILYSTDPIQIGRIDYGNDRLNQALAGNSNSELVRKGQFSDLLDEQKFNVDVVETYVPIFDRVGQVVGCVEIYRDVTSYHNEIHSGVFFSMLLLGVILSGVFGFSYLVVRKGTHDLSAALQRLTLLATTDSLCMILNRKTILRRLSEETARLSRVLTDGRQTEFSLILIDIDHFRRLNEAYGVSAGEKVLQQLAQRLQTEMRDYDALGRLGGEEFLVILPDTGLTAAYQTAERFRQLIGAHHFVVDGIEILLTISIGVTVAESRMESPEQLLRRAQQALLRAKSSGRDRVVSLHGRRLAAADQLSGRTLEEGV